MTLLDTLQGGFASGGFSVDGAFAGLTGSLGAVAPAPASLDGGALAGIGGGLGSASLSGIGPAVGSVAGIARAAGQGMPVAGDLLGPLGAAIAAVESLTAPSSLEALRGLERAGTGGGVGLAGLAAPLRAVEQAASGGPVAPVLGVLGGLLPGRLDLAGAGGLLSGSAGGIVALVQLVGALMAVDSLSRDIGSSAGLVSSLLTGDAVDGLLVRVNALAGGTADLPSAIRAASPDDPVALEQLTTPVAELATVIRTASDTLVRGMAYGEATLAHADFPRLVAELELAAGLLVESLVPPVRALALDARSRVDPLLQTALGTPAGSFDAFWGEVMGQIGALAAAIGRIDPAALAAPLTGILGDLFSALHRIELLAQQAVATFRSALDTIKQAVQAIDLRPVAEAVRAAFQPAIDALAALQGVVAGAQAAIEQACHDAVAALDGVKSTLGAAATTIHGAFQSVADTIEALHLDQLQQELQSGIGQVVQGLQGARLDPYFDAAASAISTAASVVSAVPLDLLPDSAKQDVEKAVEPVKQIDFDHDVRDVLESALHDILHTLDTDVLAEVDAAYHQVLDFLQQIDPRPALQSFEHDTFDPMLERVRAVDPSSILKPVADVLDELKSAVRGLDLHADVLQPLEQAFDEIHAAVAGLDPAAALQPVVDQVAHLRTTITGLLHLDAVRAGLERAVATTNELLARLDVDRLIGLLDAAWDGLRPAPGRHGGPSVLGTVVSGLLAGTGISARADSFPAVVGWLGGGDAAAAVSGRLAGAADALAATRAAVERADVQALVAVLQPLYRDVIAAVQGLPDGSLARTRLEAMLAGVPPLELLGVHVDNRNRYLGELDTALAAVREAAGSGRSELTAVVAGLREALRPLAAIPDRLRSLFARFGIDVDGRSLGDILRGLFDRLEPSALLAPLAAALDALKAKIGDVVANGLVAPVKQAVDDLAALLAAIDISFLRDDLVAVHAALLADVDALRPSALLGPLLESVEHTRQTILDFDPLGAARAAVAALQAAIAEVADSFRPTTLLAPVLDTYDHILQAASGLDVRKLLQPILDALKDIERQLDDGLDRTATALKALQAALP